MLGRAATALAEAQIVVQNSSVTVELSIAKFLFGLGQKALIAAVKICKQKSDNARAEALQQLLLQHEAGKPLYARIEQRLSVSLQSLQGSPELLQAARELDGDDVLRHELASAFAAGQLSVEMIREMMVKRSGTLAMHRAEVDSIATAWLEAIFVTVGDIPALGNALVLIGQQRIEARMTVGEGKLDAVLEGQKQQELRDAELHAGIQMLRSEFARLRGPDSEPAAPTFDAIQARFEQRHQKSRDRLLHGSVRQAEEEYVELIADLVAAGTLANQDLLFRARLNHSSALVELRRFEDAEAELEQARVLAPDDLRLKRHEAVLLAHRGNADRALMLVRELRIAEPADNKHLHNEAALLLDLGRLDDLARLLDEHPLDDGDHYCLVAHVALRQGRAEDAITAARRACELEPESEAPWIALANALGFPVIERRQRGETHTLSADPDDTARLREALLAAKRAADILKVRDRTTVRAEVIANSLAFYAALNEDDAALALGRELWDSGDRSEITARNLFYVQMRNGHFDEALTTAEAMVAANLADGRLRRAQALTALGHHQAVIREFEALNGTAAADDEWVQIAARAWCVAQQRERALELLEKTLENRPDSMDLQLERAGILDELGRTDAALAAFEKVEAAFPLSAQVAVDYGLFLYRQGRWAEAAARMARVGASGPANPLHVRYLISIYNAGDVVGCRNCVAAWVDGGHGYTETIYALGARCAIRCDELPTARRYLEELLLHGDTGEGEHRRMLGQVYLRLDEQEQAYNVLAKLVAEQPQDFEAHILLSQVCTARGRHAEAIDYGRIAVQLAPDNVSIRAAFFGAMIALPQDFTPTEECLVAHQKNLTALTEHPSGILRAVEVTPDLGNIKEMLTAKESQVNEVLKVADEMRMPFGFLTQTGTALHEAWAACISDAKRGIRASFGTAEAQRQESEEASKRGPVSVDILALFTLQALNLLPLLERERTPIVAHISLLDTVVEQLRRLRDHPGGGRMGTHKGQFFLSEANPVAEAKTTEFLTAIRDFLKGPSVQLVGLTPATITEQMGQLANACGPACILPMLVAKERTISLLSDDAVVRGMAKIASGVNGFCTQALLRAARNSERLSSDAYQQAVVQLIEWNYHFVWDEAATIIYLYRKSEGAPGPTADLLINRVADPACTQSAALLVLSGALAHIWAVRKPDTTVRDYWLSAIWSAILRARPDGGLIPQFLHFLAVQFLTRPAQFIGAVVWALKNVAQLKQLRVSIIRGVFEIGAAIASAPEASWPASAAEWNAQLRALQLRIKLRGI